MSNNESGKLDAAIDRAVRGMMNAEPRPGFRQRVLRRLNTQDTAGWGFLPRFALTGATLAILLSAVTLMRLNLPDEAAAPPVVATAPPATQTDRPEAIEALANPVPQPPATAQPRSERLPEPPDMADVFGERDPRVAAASLPDALLDDTRTPQTEPGTTFRSPIAGLPPVSLENLHIRMVPINPPRINPQ